MNGASEAAKLMRKLRKMGLEISGGDNGKHYIITNPANERYCRLPLTPGNGRFYGEARSKLRRLGVDIDARA
jgi:hypothetical protein